MAKERLQKKIFITGELQVLQTGRKFIMVGENPVREPGEAPYFRVLDPNTLGNASQEVLAQSGIMSLFLPANSYAVLVYEHSLDIMFPTLDFVDTDATPETDAAPEDVAWEDCKPACPHGNNPDTCNICHPWDLQP